MASRSHADKLQKVPGRGIKQARLKRWVLGGRGERWCLEGGGRGHC